MGCDEVEVLPSCYVVEPLNIVLMQGKKKPKYFEWF